MKLLLIAIAALSIQSASARMGESLNQCIVRYGQPAESQGQYHIFIKNGFRIYVMMDKQIVGGIIYEKIDKDNFSDIEIQTLLKTNSNNEWKLVRDEFREKSYLSNNHNMAAIYYPFDKRLGIMTKDSASKAAADYEQSQKDKLEGL